MATEISKSIQCKTREHGSKSDLRHVREMGLVPAISYGPGQQTRYLAVDPKSFVQQRRAYGTSHIYDVNVEGGTGFKCLIKEIQQDPVSQELLHIDLYEVDMNKPIRVEVPVELVGKPAGAIDGGILSQVMRLVVLRCLPNKVPAKLTVDVSHLKIGDSIHVSEMKIPEGIKLVSNPDETVAICAAPEEEKIETPVAAAVDGAPADGAAAAAPAAGGAEAAKAGAKPGDAKAAPAADAKGAPKKDDAKKGK